jgi:hypothetical protein
VLADALSAALLALAALPAVRALLHHRLAQRVARARARQGARDACSMSSQSLIDGRSFW